MIFRTSTAALAFALSVASFCGSAAAENCAQCPSSIFYSGQTRSLTSSFQSSVGNVVQCNYGSPPISGFNPFCDYQNVDGSLTLTNTGGACPFSTTVVVKAFC